MRKAPGRGQREIWKEKDRKRKTICMNHGKGKLKNMHEKRYIWAI